MEGLRLRQPGFAGAAGVFLGPQPSFLFGAEARLFFGLAARQRGFRRAGETDVRLVDAPEMRRNRVFKGRDDIVAMELFLRRGFCDVVAEKLLRAGGRLRLHARALNLPIEEGGRGGRIVGRRRGGEKARRRRELRLLLGRREARLANIGPVGRQAKSSSHSGGAS